jgi:catechol 2,3-dioxygenase-like lactoylglutathione lyase family enzyme
MSPDGPILDQLNLVVADVATSVEFYRLLGLTIPDTAPEWQLHHRSATLPGGIDLDFDSLEFAAVWDRGWPAGRVGAGGVIGFRLSSREDVDATYARVIAAGYGAQQEPYDAFWGARYAIVEDPDGNAVGLMSPIDPSRRTAPPTPPS